MRPRRSFAHVQRPEAFGVKFRSRLEFRYACYLEMLRRVGKVREWSYETTKFSFSPDSAGAIALRLCGVRHGVTSYKPDFKVTFEPTRSSACGGWASVEWHEVKGYMDRRSRTALARMKRYYPSERVVVVQAVDVKRLGF